MYKRFPVSLIYLYPLCDLFGALPAIYPCLEKLLAFFPPPKKFFGIHVPHHSPGLSLSLLMVKGLAALFLLKKGRIKCLAYTS